VVGEIEVFDAQAQTFHQAQSAAVQDLSHQAVDTLHVFDDGFGLLFREHGWDMFGFGGAEVTDGGLVQFDLQDMAI